MRYQNFEIPDSEIENNMKYLGVSRDKAIQIWLEDNGKAENEEQALLNEIASAVKIEHGAKEKPTNTKPRKPRTVKITDEKMELFNSLRCFLEGYALNHGATIETIKEGKKVMLTLPTAPERPLTVDIIQKTPKK